MSKQEHQNEVDRGERAEGLEEGTNEVAGSELENEYEVLRQERDELYDRLARVSADYQNFQKRSEQNLSDSLTFARGDLLKLFVPVIDHFDTALGHEPQSDDARALHEGVRIVREELLKVLQQCGVERIDVNVGDRFDPHRHEAMMRHAAEGIEPNHVTMAMQPGYVYRNRTLRAAKVAVAPDE